MAGRYRIERELARGGMGTVYAAVDQVSGQRLALKRLQDDHGRADERRGTLFQREYYTLRQLRHPSIIEVHDYGSDEAGPYYTMELLDGSDLHTLAPLGVAETCRILRDVASSLALLHARRLLHRDVTARNVRVGSNGRAKLLDFGALVTFGVSSQIVGTPPAVPPEALHRLPLDQRADLYGLGALAYFMLTREHAYPAQRLAQLTALWSAGAPRPPSALRDGIPPELDDLVLSLLAHDALARPRSAADVIERLTSIGRLPPEAHEAMAGTYLINPPLVGRERELGRIMRVVERVTSGARAALVVRGVDGSGKTRLLGEALLGAQVTGATVASVDAELHEGPHATLREIIRVLQLALPEHSARAARAHAAWLGHVAPELASAAGVTRLAEIPRDRAEHNIRMQEAAIGYLTGLAVERPIAIAIDNAAAADESSLAALAYAVQGESAARLMLLLSVRDGSEDASPQIASLARKHVLLALGPLSFDAVTQLVRGLFGDVDNAGRLGAWLHERTGGNPTHCMELVSRLVGAGRISYLAGSWSLPAELPPELANAHLGDMHEQSLEALSPAARKLAENLSVERVVMDVGRCVALADDSAEAAFAGLAELVGRGVLVASDDRYRFSHTALRKHLLDSLPDARRAALHRRVAALILERDDCDSERMIDAGWHLIRGGDALRGAHLLEEASRNLVMTIEGLRFAAPALEAALEVYDRTEQNAWLKLPVLDALTAAGWYVDHRYVARYGERTLRLAMDLSGLARADRLARWLPDRIALQLGLLGGMLRHALQRKHVRSRRLRKFPGVFAPLVGSVGILIGIAANTLDGARARELLDSVRMMSAFAHDHVLSVMYRYARYFTLAAEGRFGEAEPTGLEVLAWFRSPAALRVLGEEGARALSGGIMTGIAEFASFHDAGDPEGWARELEGLGLSFYAVMGTQARFSRCMVRGEPAEAAHYREQLELHAVQGGTTWQTSVVIPTLSAAAHARAGDTVALRQATEALERIAEQIPVLGHYARVYRAYRELLRGSAATALGQLEALLPSAGYRCWPEWVFAHGAYIRALISQGQLERAGALLSQLQARIDPRDREYAFATLDADLVAAELATAKGALDDAAAQYDALIEAHRPRQGPLTLCRLYAARAQLALQQRDEDAFDRHLEALRTTAAAATHAIFVARAKRLEREASRVFDREHRGAVASGGRAPLTSMAALSLLETTALEDRAATALRLALEQSGAPAGYLYLRSGANLELASSAPRDMEPPDGLLDELHALVTQAQGLLLSDDVTHTALEDDLEVTAVLGAMQTELLVRPGAGVVGALALERPQGAALMALDAGLLSAIARSCA